MTILVDSGSTKTTWVLLNKKEKLAQCSTQGYSPSVQTTDTIKNLMQAELPDSFLQEKDNASLRIFYYGTGCSTPHKIQIVQQALQGIFSKAHIEVQHDLYAAALALCGHQAGIACILGTGSNSCYFDGNKIQENVPSLGYFFGDQGSGSYIGKALLQQYLEETLPADLQKKFSEIPSFQKEFILEGVYKNAMPQRFLASYTKIVSEHIEHVFMQQLVKKCFRDFLNYQVEQYSMHKKLLIHFVGSVAFYFQKQMEEVLQEKNLNIGTVLQSPMEGLIRHHTKE
ncbi:MAG: hypothetical protein JST67_07660 [Bacteroidetes bacterium]|nr:hypothetical protein [Bacteroidota bacterium]